MATFHLPDLGEGLAEAEILAWHVKPGDRVAADQPMVSVETAKAVVEVPVPFGGTVTALHGAVGDVIATGAPLIDFDSGTVVGSMPTARVDNEYVDAGLPGGTRTGTCTGTHTGPADRRRALPAARALASHLHLPLEDITGTGAGGVVTLDDVLARSGVPRPAESRAACLDTPPGAVREELRGARRAMAHSMSRSHAEIPASSVFDDADIHAWSKRGRYMQRLMRALIAAWRIEPALNAWYDAVGQARILLPHIDLAIAVDTPHGLIVPVVRGIQDKSPEELEAALEERKRAAHERTLAPEDLAGFTLMLSNFGTLAGRHAVPLVVPPAVAILGAGKVRGDAVAVAESVVVRRRMPLSLSFDHRCVTGGEACRFLAAVIADLEKTD
jgi:2-oxoisovalerate dehydrogenase E2 component (dihydrolipoyl transacylase)